MTESKVAQTGLYPSDCGTHNARNGNSLIGDWQETIAQADMADWVTAAAYILAAALSLISSVRASRPDERRERLFWHITAGLLAALAINELLDLQTLLTILGREFAKSAGWYGAHRTVQYIFVIGLTAFAVAVGLAMLWLTRRADFAVRLAAIGLIFIGLFVLLRAASFHHLDELLGRDAAQFSLGSLQEMAGIAVITWAAALYTRRRDHRR